MLLDSITGVLGAPFLLEDPANQFLRLKRHIYLQDYWKPDHSPTTWGNTLVDQVFALRTKGPSLAPLLIKMTFLFCIGVQLINNVMLVSGVPQSGSAIHIHHLSS